MAADGSSLKLVGAEVVSQSPTTISQIMPASAATGRLVRTMYLNVVFTRNLSPRYNRDPISFPDE